MTENNRRHQERQQTWGEEKEGKWKMCRSTKPMSWRRTREEDEGGEAEEWQADRGIMAAGCPPMAWGVVMLHADEVPHRRWCCQVLALSQSPFSSMSPWPPPAPGTPLGPALYNPRGALQPGIQHQAPRHFSCTYSHIVGYTLIHKPINNRHTQLQPKKLWEMGLYHHHSVLTQQDWTKIQANNHRLTHSFSHMPIAAKDLQQLRTRLCAGIHKICCPLSATRRLAMPHWASLKSKNHNKAFITFGGGFFSRTSKACKTRFEKRGPIGT